MPFLICNTTEYVAVTNGKIRSVSDISLAKFFEGEGEARAFFATLAPYFKNHDFAVTKTRVKPNWFCEVLLPLETYQYIMFVNKHRQTNKQTDSQMRLL